VQLRLGRLDAALRAGRIVLVDAARRWDAATDEPMRTALLADLALAKVTATNAAVAATDEALRIAGGPGFLAGRLERAFRDARAGLINPPSTTWAGAGRAILDRAREADERRNTPPPVRPPSIGRAPDREQRGLRSVQERLRQPTGARKPCSLPPAIR
jgi:alkylation response protein AidB-like acyl-CoA dehydrogenase